MKGNKSVEEYIEANTNWKPELIALHNVLKKTGLKEEIKWGQPTYTFEGKNIVGMGAFTNYFGLWFYQGALLKDNSGKLVNAQKGKTQAMRQWRMTTIADIDTELIQKYIAEAVENEKAGKRVKVKKKELIIPDELADALAQDDTLKNAFYDLTPGKQREYADYISDAKREKTRLTRIDKISPMIKAKIGLNDKYR